MAERATIRDVAAQSGYSIATVSMVLNNKEVSIPQATREKVWEAAKNLNYRPNSLAVSLITKRTRVLGLVIPDNRSMFFSTLSLSIEAAARRAGYALIYGNSGNVGRRDIEYLEMFLDRQVDGIVLLMSTINDQNDAKEILRLIETNAVPVVTVDRAVPGGHLPIVQMDHEKAGYLATRHLLELGHRRIGCCISPGFLTARIEKGQGYRRALQEFGVEFDEELLFEVSYKDEMAYKGGVKSEVYQRIMAKGVTAVITVNDSMAMEFYRYTQRAGMRIPEDISVVGSDDSPFADMLSPPLTTVRQPVRDIGEATIRTLLGMIENEGSEDAPMFQKFEPELIVRDSTGPVTSK